MDNTTVKLKINPMINYTILKDILYNDYESYDFSPIMETEEYRKYRYDFMTELFQDASALELMSHVNALLNIEQHIHDGSLDKEILRDFVEFKCKK
jgi:hypothetical protein